MTLILIVYLFLIIMFMGYFNYMFSIARLSLYSSTCSYSAHPNDRGVSGRQCVNVVFILCLPMDAPYILGQQVVDRGSDSSIESSVVHSSNIGLVGPGSRLDLALFLIRLRNVPCV
jgi:hypothetical protein